MVEAVDAEDDGLRIAEVGADLLRLAPPLRISRQVRDVCGVDRDRIRLDDPALGPRIDAEQTDARGGEVLDIGLPLEADDVGAGSPESTSVRHGSCAKSPTGGNGMWQKNPILTSGRSDAPSRARAAADSHAPTPVLRGQPRRLPPRRTDD